MSGMNFGGFAVHGLVMDRLRLVTLLPHAGLTNIAILVASHITTAVIPALNALAAGALVRAVVESARPQTGLTLVLAPIGALVGLLVGARIARLGQEIAGFGTARQIDGWVRCRVREIALAPPGIAHLEQSTFQDDAMRASDLGGLWRRRSPGTAVVGQCALMFRIISALLAAAVLAEFSPLLAIALLAASLVMRGIIRRQWMHLADLDTAGVPDQRRADYWADLTVSAPAAIEVRLFGLGDWLMAKRHAATLEWLSPLWHERRGILWRQGPIIALAFGSALAALLAPGVASAEGRIELGQLATYLVAAWGIFGISSMGYEAYDVEYGMGAVHALDRLTASTADTASSAAISVPGRSESRAPAIRLEQVQFSYPGTATAVLDELDLEIRAGEVLAVVGRNGAGKTTLVKLLAGLYQPTAGRIVVDGVDLAAFNVERWRERLAALFQDFVHYPGTVRDNIALAAPESLADDAGVRAAAQRAGVTEMISLLPGGLDTPLWRGGTGGVELSGGQWQKLALARILFAEAHGRRLLVFDEPTAHLDVGAEAAFFAQIIAAVTGATVVLISHRLSTVRQADRIVVLDGGRIVECGTHDLLLARDGQYARLFRLQAARFTAESPE